MEDKPKVVAIVGPTASGKTALSIALAKQFNGEVISADSRQVYRGLDLGTGKVTPEEMAGIPHHLLDIREPMEVYTGADFAIDAAAALTKVIQRQHLPIIAGGSFFYLDLLRGRRQAAPVEPNETFRESIKDLSNATLHEKLSTLDPLRASTIDPHNRRRLVRALEIVNVLGLVPPTSTLESPYEWLIIGIDIPQENLHQNIRVRLLKRIELGMIDEAKTLHAAGMSYERMDALGLEYRFLAKYLQNELTHDEMVIEIENKTRQFAKRQMTWLHRDEMIEWYAPENREAIFRRIEQFLHGVNS